MKKKQSFISDINVVNDSIIVEYSDGNTKIESYSYDKYAELSKISKKSGGALSGERMAE